MTATTERPDSTLFNQIREISRSLYEGMLLVKQAIVKATEIIPTGKSGEYHESLVEQMTEEERAAIFRSCAALSETVTRTRLALFALPTTTLADQARRVLDLRVVAEEAKAAKQAADITLAEAERTLIERMVEEEVSSTKLSDGTNLYLSRKGYCSKASGVETDQLVEALRKTTFPGTDRTFGDFVRDSVNYAGLKGAIGQIAEKYEQEHPGSTIEEALPESLRGLLRVYEEQTLNVRRGKKSA